MISFFGTVDRNKKGSRASEVPSWAMQTHITDLKESIDSKERAIERGDIPLDAISQTKAEIQKERQRLTEILESKPKASSDVEDKLWKIYKSLGKDIQDTLFTRSDMKLGLASPHEEAKRMVNPIIKVNKEIVELCKENGVPVTTKGNEVYLTRNNASKIWKWTGHFLGEPTNVETLRKDKVTAKTGRIKE